MVEREVLRARPKQITDHRSVPALASLPTGGFMELDGQIHYRIAAFDRMDPFLMSIPSDTDLWMFITSGGGLTAGRVDPDGSLFPYCTVNQLHQGHHHTGPLTLIRVEMENGESLLWEPFTSAKGQNPDIERNLLKNVTGNRLVFQEIRHDLGLEFHYAWSACDSYGWVRSVTLENTGTSNHRISVIDGLRNILPYGAPLSLYQASSNLVDAYKKSEVDPDTGLGIFSLTAGITDRAEAVEVLRANTVWCAGLEEFRVHLTLGAVEDFKRQRIMQEDSLVNGTRGHYLISAHLDLNAGQSSCWHLVGDTGLDHLAVSKLQQKLMSNEDQSGAVMAELKAAENNLRHLVATADGLQASNRTESSAHHFANVLFNNMRGGVFSENYQVPVSDFIDFIGVRNRNVANRHQYLLVSLPEKISIQDLHQLAEQTQDPHFQRLCLEYLPLHFGRRHGDPSRPWNRFSINVQTEDGEKAVHYEGNWRDIFQNWEALGTSFPVFLPHMVAKFVNASTVDGFNPYRINRDGVDWEVTADEDPWSNIGYWGDHQIIYLLKLLEAWNDHDPKAINQALDAKIYSYAEVPYRLKSYEEILQNPSETIDFDHELAKTIDGRVVDFGTDGKLLTGQDGEVHHANLFEKLLVPALSKLSNLVPDAGIWMNTQRPEWNDANNALAGGGVSVVTLCHLRRYLVFLADCLEAAGDQSLPVASEIVTWFNQIASAIGDVRVLLSSEELNTRSRKQFLDTVGNAFDAYRQQVYSQGFTCCEDLSTTRVIDLCHQALSVIDQGLNRNRRRDGLFHTYNLLEPTSDDSGMKVKRLQIMLEGQVAILTSGVLNAEESLEILDKLFASDLYRKDQRSFLLYPERTLPGFLERNTVPEKAVTSIALVNHLLSQGDRSLLIQDAKGIYRFAAPLRNAGDLELVLDNLSRDIGLKEAVSRDRQAVLDLFENVFRHKSFTGRSGTMYGYEGLGCIYWHMVAKLLLAVQETMERAAEKQSSPEIMGRLARMYFRVRAGIGYEKSVAEYGAFPTDPYSHTPGSGGAKQPGMTGQVKEEILTRRGELGILIEEGCIRFAPKLLRQEEYLAEPKTFRFVDVHGIEHSHLLPSGSLAFTICQVPVIYEGKGSQASIRIISSDGSVQNISGHTLDSQLSGEIFSRSGIVGLIKVTFPVSKS
jgi:hypothetical protein